MNEQGFTPSLETQATGFEERRSKPRVQCSYPAVLRGHPEGGMRYEARAVLANMSACGMYLRTKRHILPCEALSVVVRLSTSPLSEETQPRLAVTGDVVRVERKPDGTYGVGLRIQSHRYL